MPSVTGIFTRFEDAKLAAMNITTRGIDLEEMNLLTPGTEADVATVPTTDAEQPGVGKAFGGLLGGALAAAGGMHLGAAAASLMVPGVGPVLALGTAAAVVAGVGGAAGGAALGDYLDDSATKGLPTDELYLYKDALRKGRSVLVVPIDNDEQADDVRAILAASGAESLDAARESWWIGLRDAEAAEYTGGEDFTLVEAATVLGSKPLSKSSSSGNGSKMPFPISPSATPKSCAVNPPFAWDMSAANGIASSYSSGIRRSKRYEERPNGKEKNHPPPDKTLSGQSGGIPAPPAARNGDSPYLDIYQDRSRGF